MDMMLHRLIGTLWGKTEISRASIAAEDAEIGMDNREGKREAESVRNPSRFPSRHCAFAISLMAPR